MTRSVNGVFFDRPLSIFPTMSALANQHGAINLGQGFPDEDGPREILEAAAQAVIEGPNQYVASEGLPELRQAVARANKRFYGLDVDWRTQTLVTCGAVEALASAFFGFLEPGDEAILIAPSYDSYAPMVEAAGARARIVSLRPPDWRLEESDLKAAVNAKTKLIAVNSPQNPTGKVFSHDELEATAAIARDHDLLVVCDEVYEHLIFDGLRHEPLMTLPGMAERCVRIGSAGKTFSLTGWRIGYATGPERLIAAMTKTHQFLTYTIQPHLQKAVAYGLDMNDGYYEAFVASMQEKRDLMAEGLARAGFRATKPQGTYFMIVDIRDVGYDGGDMAFCREITEHAKVAAVPVSAFYHPDTDDIPRHYARFCFCKKPALLKEASARLKAYFA
ncbi:MAG: aminotransferase [Parvularculaceae bacterium]